MKNILIVEDEIFAQEILKTILSNFFNIFIASNGKEGLNVIKNNAIDLILTDIEMPKMNGIEMTK